MKVTSVEKNSTSVGILNKKISTVLIHLLMWLALFSLPLLFRPQSGHGPESGPLSFIIPIPMWMNDLFLVIAFYTNLFVLMPKFFNKKKWGYYALFTCIFLAGSFFIHTIAVEVDHIFGQQFIQEMGRRPKPPEGFEFRHFSFIYMFVMVWALSMVYFLVVKLQESTRHADEVYATALQSELSFLKAQINPHFLFNTLNNIYVLTLKKTDEAPLAVMKLSNLMRQMTSDTGVDFVPFEDEIKFIQDYIELQGLRLTPKTKVRYEIYGNFEKLKIVPRLLIPFIDNAFKYGVSNREASEIIIRFEFIKNKMFFNIQNSIHASGGESLESSGVGLGNAKRRLDLLYKGKHVLKITKTQESYCVHLEIDLS